MNLNWLVLSLKKLIGLCVQGFTVQVDENENLVVARVLTGGVIERQGLLHPGDVILEVNNVNVTSPDELQFEVTKAKENVTLRIAPSQESVASLKTHQVTEIVSSDIQRLNYSRLPFVRPCLVRSSDGMVWLVT